jgi:acetyltransferase-like isoleucine patch superfamily enzyme
MNIINKIRNQSIIKISIIIYNCFRIPIIKAFHSKLFEASFIQNINPSTEIFVKGKMKLAHSIFTRRNVTFRAEGGNLKIGTSFFNQGCCITCLKSIKIGDGCLFGPNVTVVDHDHVFRKEDLATGQKYNCSEILIGNNVWIGANVVILRGTIIGDNCVIGAGAIVKGHFPNNTKIICKQIINTTNIE